MKKSVTDIFAISSNILVIVFRFSPLNVKQTCFPGPKVDSPCTLFTFTYLLRCVVYDVILVIVIDSSLALCESSIILLELEYSIEYLIEYSGTRIPTGTGCDELNVNGK